MSRAAQQQSAGQYAPAVLWLVLVFIVVVVLILKLSLDRAERAYQQQVEAATAAAEQRHLALIEKTDPERVAGITATELQRLIGTNTPISMRSYGSNYHAYWTDPQTNADYRFHFDSHRRFVDRSGRWVDWLTPLPTRTSSDRPQEIISRIGDWLAPMAGGFRLPIAFIPWVALYIEYRRRPRSRGIFAWLFVSWSLLCVVIWLAGSERLLSLNGVLDHQSNFWGAIMLTATCVALTYGGLRNSYNDPLACNQCGYSLKGNQSGTCPECGGSVPPSQQQLLA